MAELQVAPYMWILVLFFLSLLQPTEPVRNALDGPTLEPGQPVQPTVQPTQPPNQTEEWRPSTVTEVGKCSIKLGDHFDAASSILLPLDLAWLSGSALIALALILWTPDGLSTRAVGAHGEAPMEEGADEGEGGEDSRSPDSKDAPESTSGAETVQRPKLEAIGWHRVAFDSITSHAAGIVGFIGFQKIVVARIVALSDACDLWSIENILLYTTLALSVVAVFASFVFLGVDYARRLAIYAAQRKGYQLTMKPKDLKETGLGIAIILLGLLMLFLYGCVIVEEAETSDAEQQEMVIDKRWVVVDIAAGGIALALFYFNLRGLHRSPKMQFDAACHGEHKLTLEEFLEGESGQGMATNVSDYASLADFLHWLAGEDLVLLAFKGTRHAIFPQQRRGPLVHVVCGVLAIGAFPLLVQLGAERFFGYPDLVELKSTTGTIAEIELDGVMERPSWSLQTLQTLVNPKARRKKFVFLGDEMAARIQVRTTYQKTSTVQLCCRNGEIGQIPCSSGKLNHRLIKFFTQPVDLDVPPNVSSDCQLILQGFSSRAVTHIPVELTPKREHHLCDCTLEGCKCCGGYKGSLRFNSSRSLEIPAKGYKSLSSLCTPARCDVAKSTGEAGPNCKCQDKYVGQILWNGSIAMGKCEPAPCKGDLLNGLPGPDCSCKDGYTGKTRMVEDFISVFPGCLEAECKVPNSTGKGPKCKCQNGFEGDIRWKGAEAHGSCKPAWCNVSNSNQKRGHQCACLELYQGKIHWDGAIAKGTCEPMTCVGENVNGLRGPDCTCLNGYRGSVLPIQLPMDGSGVAGFLKGTCKAVPCNITNSNKVLGPGCQCKAGFKGNITWKGPVPYGSCEASLCDIANSNGKPGPACKCKFGFGGKVQWRGPQAFGTCWPLHCAGQHVNGVAGPGCSCADGFAPAGKFAYAYTNLASPGIANDIQAIVFRYSGRINSMVGNCSEAPCTIENSNRAPGPSCRCMDGYSGRISWKGSIAQGRCKPALCNIANSNWNGGLDCHCLDGYRGHISWNEHQPSGSCTAVPCRIPHSDFAPGPECQCLPGFHGQIKWIGTQATGECLPIPRCSPNIVYATWLQDELKDPHGYDCDPGQQLVFHGHACDQGKVQWTSVRSLLPGRCRWALSLECGQDPDSKVSQLFSAVSPQLPGECSVEAAAPRCDPQLDYTVTSRRASGYSCGAGSGKVSETQQVQFQGHLCGYDLIQWEAAVLLQEPASDPSLALSCRIKSLSHNSFSCGEIPEGEDLPRGCLQMHQAASFRIWEWQEKTAPFEPTARQWKSVYSMKLFENGMAAVRHLGKDQVGKSYWSTGWFTDGKYLDVRMPNMMDNGAPRPGFFFRVLDDDSQGYKFLSSNKLFRLKASNTLPSWWVSAFQDRTASGKIDSLWQCELSHYENGTCYQAKVGVAVQIFQSSEEMCSSWIVNLNKSADFDYFTYLHSAHEVQTYASKAECLPIAARHELQLEIAEIHSAGPGAFVVASMETRCRQTLRFVASAADLTKCKNKADAQWKARQRPFSNQHTGTDDDDEDEDHDEDYDYDEDENYDDFDSMDEMDDSMDDTSHAMEEVD